LPDYYRAAATPRTTLSDYVYLYAFERCSGQEPRMIDTYDADLETLADFVGG
jgi:hypothetical protein